MLVHGARWKTGRLRARVADDRERLPRGRLVEFVRLLFVLLFTVAGYTIGTNVGDATTTRTILAVVLGSATGFVLGGVLGRQTATAVKTMEEELRRVPAAEVVAGIAGLIMGLAMAALLSVPVFRLPPLAAWTSVAFMYVTLGYVGFRVGTTKSEELFGLIGPNGAGKTTVFNVITGVYAPTHGRIGFEGRPIHGLKPHAVARRGITRTFQNIRLFGSRCCRDNVCIAAHQHAEAGLLDAVFRTGRFARDEARLQREARELLEVMGLSQWADTAASDLPYGQQRRLEIARALAGRPRLLLLDEPAAGLNPLETDQLMHLIEEVRRRFGLTILLIEHDMRVVMGICRRIAVLDYGVKIAEGTPDQIRTDPQVIEAYLGEEVDADLAAGA